VTPYFAQDGVTLYHGDCREILQGLPDESVSAVVTDPPYGLSFMGKRWDYDVPGVDVWQQVLRVLKPGGHLLAFAGTRTQHRMAVRIEDAGFEIRDMIAWVYGSGFPKSLDVSKAIDRAAGAEGSRGPMKRGGERLARLEDGKRDGEGRWGDEAGRDPYTYLPFTPEAQQWQGCGTALKPALEPITVARKPLIGTVAENVLAHGTGGINVDGCRVGDEVRHAAFTSLAPCKGNRLGAADTAEARQGTQGDPKEYTGRWPANLIHDGSEEVTALLGEAARFFYTAKADKSDRGPGNNHPTVKPVDLMRYLVRLVCPIGGVVLDPFSGSGTTLAAAQAEGCLAIGVEREAAYCEIIKGRFHQRRLF
jgi:site-specific DNA-methyltransferase (adenine-specific)